MKKIIVFTSLIFCSCQEEGILTQDQPQEVIAPTAALRFSGIFVPTSGISVSGATKIYLENGSYKLQLENFNITEGPDLKVYLSQSASPDQFLNLGNLTSQTVYSIPQSVVISEYSHVLIHCQQYNHLFAIAELQQN